MAVTPKPLGDGQLPTTKATLYQCPADTRAIVKLVSLVNVSASLRTVNIYVNVSGTSRRVVPKDWPIAVGEQVLIEDIGLYLDAGDLLEGRIGGDFD